MTLELEREDVVQKLCAAYARDQLSTGELESRLERVYKSGDRTELLTVLKESTNDVRQTKSISACRALAHLTGRGDCAELSSRAALHTTR